jgi:hypothetical protein
MTVLLNETILAGREQSTKYAERRYRHPLVRVLAAEAFLAGWDVRAYSASDSLEDEAREWVFDRYDCEDDCADAFDDFKAGWKAFESWNDERNAAQASTTAA